MKSPVVFIFNIRRSVYDAFGTTHFNQIKNLYKDINLLPIVNNLDEGIEQRAEKIKEKLPKMLKKLNTEQVHLFSYSVSGIDTRYALSALNMGQYVKTLTTIATPNHGSKTANFSQRNFFKKVQIDPIARLLGIGIKPFHEVVPENIKFFNEQIRDVDSVQYFSIGAQRGPTSCHHSMRQICQYLRTETQKNYTYENDGVFGHDEIEWGNHLANFDADHSEVVGLTDSLKRVKTFDLALQNAYSTQTIQKSSTA